MAAENVAPVWERYDESADLAELAEHENESMHFKRLNSRLLDKNDLWVPFAEQLQGFSAADYARLKPLIVDKSIASMQQAVADGSLTYEAVVTFYIYRIREIESDNKKQYIRRHREDFTDPRDQAIRNGLIYFIFFLSGLAVILCLTMICLVEN